MYELVRSLIDDFLMGPQLWPLTTFGVVLLLAVATLNTIAGSSSDDIDEEDT